MSDLLKSGLEKLRSIDRSNRSQSVTYSRGGTSETVLATFGQSEFEAKDRQGFVVTHQMDDFIISVADLSTFGDPVLGDIIVHSGVTYKVLAPRFPNDEPPFRYTDSYRIAFRIHTKVTG